MTAVLFELMPADVRALVEASCVPVSYGFGETVVAEGDPADALFIVTSGRVRVVKATEDGEVALGVLGPGDVFGEAALVGHGQRTATIRASGAVDVLKLDRLVFDALVHANPAVRKWADAQARRHELSDFFRLHSTFAGLPAGAIARLVALARPRELARGETLPPREDLLVVKQGRLAVERDGVVVAALRRGDVAGADDSVRALTDCVLLALEPFPEALERLQRPSRLLHVPLDFAADLELVAEAEPEPEPAIAVVEEEHAEAPPEAAHRRRIRRFPVVWQVDEMDCGAACLAAVCRHFGRAVPLTFVREAVGTALDGTSLRGLAAGAERLGLKAQPLKASKSRLDRLPLPAICHWQGNHWLVLYGVGRRHVRVSDPAGGIRRIPKHEWDEHWSGYCCAVEATPALAEAPESYATWRWLGPFVRPHRRPLILATALALVTAVLQMLIPIVSGKIVDEAIGKHDHGLLNLLALGMLALLALASAAALGQRYLLARVAVRFDTATLDFITERLLALPASYFASRRTGDIERRLAGMRQVRVYLVQEGVVGLTSVTQLVVAVVLMLTLSPLLTLVFVATAPLYGLAMAYSRRRLKPLLASLEEAYGRYQSRQIDAIKGIETVKARGAERALAGLIRAHFRSLADRVYRSDVAYMRYDAIVGMITFLTLALTLWVGGLLVLDGRLSVGELVAFNGLVLLANGPVGAVLRLWDELQYAGVLLDRLEDVLAQEPEQGADRSALRPVPTLGGQVSVRGLTVQAGDETILDGVTIEARPGETVAIVGRSGAGKTTLVRCLSGLVTPTSGRILYDGVDLATLDHRELRSRIGFVLQDDHLFNDTLTANIALGDEAADHERVRWAARVADAAEFIERLPLGYDTRVGESGLRLSGGQKQRVAIARAVYRRPPVLILDEATSSLDTESERAVKESIGALLEGRTAFVIAHRLSTIRDADKIVVLERGRVAEQGTHEELLARRGLYWHLAGSGVRE